MLFIASSMARTMPSSCWPRAACSRSHEPARLDRDRRLEDRGAWERVAASPARSGARGAGARTRRSASTRPRSRILLLDDRRLLLRSSAGRARRTLTPGSSVFKPRIVSRGRRSAACPPAHRREVLHGRLVLRCVLADETRSRSRRSRSARCRVGREAARVRERCIAAATAPSASFGAPVAVPGPFGVRRRFGSLGPRLDHERRLQRRDDVAGAGLRRVGREAADVVRVAMRRHDAVRASPPTAARCRPRSSIISSCRRPSGGFCVVPKSISTWRSPVAAGVAGTSAGSSRRSRRRRQRSVSVLGRYRHRRPPLVNAGSSGACPCRWSAAKPRSAQVAVEVAGRVEVVRAGASGAPDSGRALRMWYLSVPNSSKTSAPPPRGGRAPVSRPAGFRMRWLRPRDRELLELVGTHGQDLHVVRDRLAQREAVLVDAQARPHRTTSV